MSLGEGLTSDEELLQALSDNEIETRIDDVDLFRNSNDTVDNNSTDTSNSTSGVQPIVIGYDDNDLPTGWKCVDMTMNETQMVTKNSIHCTHVMEQRCHVTYRTQFKATKV